MSRGFQQPPAQASTNLQRGKSRPAADRASRGLGGLLAPPTRWIAEGAGTPACRRRPRTHARTLGQARRPAAILSFRGLCGQLRERACQQPEACPLPRWWRRRQGGRCHMAQRPMIFRAALPAEHERRKCRGAAFSVPAAAPAGYITRRRGDPAALRPASRLPQDALSPATPSVAAGSRPR